MINFSSVSDIPVVAMKSKALNITGMLSKFNHAHHIKISEELTTVPFYPYTFKENTISEPILWLFLFSINQFSAKAKSAIKSISVLSIVLKAVVLKNIDLERNYY